MDDFLAITKALSDPNRVRAILALRRGELCACQIIELLGIAPSTVSKHMSILKQAGLVLSRKQERWMHYRLAGKSAKNVMVSSALQWVFQTLEQNNCARRDQKELARIAKQDLTKLCEMRRSKLDEKQI
jgi:ArsR family transcriptional regulator, arsenate/arsenite/antimonite-responsive transcriptional repressor